MSRIQPGRYKHFKGGFYTVLFTAACSTNLCTSPEHRAGVAADPVHRLVVYVSHTYGEIHIRDLDEFTEFVKWPDGKMRTRFIQWTGD
jgi:hypothetical protein